MIWDALYIFQDEKCRLMRNLSFGSQTSDVTKVGQYKCRTGTNVGTGANVGLGQTSDLYKRRTSTNVGRMEKRRTFEFEKRLLL